MKTIVIIAHLVFIVFALASPFLIPWYLVLLAIVLLHLQYAIHGACILTTMQFGRGDKDMTFWYYMLNKLGFSFSKIAVKHFVDTILPLIIIALAILWQITLNYEPIWTMW